MLFNNCRTNALLIGVFCALLLPARFCFAWGEGHKNVARQVFAHLPESITGQMSPAAIDKAINVYALYPDSMELFKADDVGADAVKFLNDNGIKNRYGIHSDKGRALAFVLLVNAFREKQFDHASLWIAALSHSTSDMAAINHEPLIHSIIYTSAYKLKLPDGKSASELGLFDLSVFGVKKYNTGEIWPNSIEPFLIKDDGRDGATALLEIMGYGQEGADFCGKRAIPLVSDGVDSLDQNDPAKMTEAQTKLAELGAWAVGRTVRDTLVAYRLSQSADSVELTPTIEAKFTEKNDEFIRNRKLADDAIFAPIIRPVKADGPPVIGVVLEPTWRMNDAMLGYGDRILTASICRTLGNAKRDYGTIDVRDLLTTGVSAARVPTLVVSATALRNYGWMHVSDLNNRLQTYLDEGGKLIWIGGEVKPPAVLSAVANAMTRTKDPFPNHELLQSTEHLQKTNLVLVDGQKKTDWPFVRSPVLKVGWTQPVSPWLFEKPQAAKLEPLIELQDENVAVVGVTWKGADTKTVQGAYLPIYSLAPRLFNKSDVMDAPTMPALEAPAETIFFDVLTQLRG